MASALAALWPIFLGAALILAALYAYDYVQRRREFRRAREWREIRERVRSGVWARGHGSGSAREADAIADVVALADVLGELRRLQFREAGSSGQLADVDALVPALSDRARRLGVRVEESEG